MGRSLVKVYEDVGYECLPDEYLPDEYEGPKAGTLKEMNGMLCQSYFHPDVNNSDISVMSENNLPKMAEVFRLTLIQIKKIFRYP